MPTPPNDRAALARSRRQRQERDQEAPQQARHEPGVCPSCRRTEALTRVIGDLTVCPHCARTLVMEDDGTARVARQSDLTPYDEAVPEALRAARRQIRRRGHV